jgi:hypothetical protein
MPELCLALTKDGQPARDLQSGLARWGPEPPPYRTPRTAALLLATGPRAWLGAAVEPDEATAVEVDLKRGLFQCLPCASGAVGSTAPIGSDVKAELVEVALSGLGAEALAEAVYGLFDADLMVCASAAVWDAEADAWHVAVRNLHQE